MRKILAMLLITAVLLTACSSGGYDSKASSDVPSSFFNTIMVTENGYYFNDGAFELKFFDKKTSTEVYLCNKPECLHDGNSYCTATSDNMRISDSVLYDNAIYLLCQENESESVSVSVYKASLDGSELTRLYEVATLKKSAEQVYELMLGDMIIHKNRIYLTYKLASDLGAFGFGKAQFCEINMDNDKVNVLYEAKDNFDVLPSYFCGIEDKLYYAVYGASSQIFEYDLKTNKTKEFKKGFLTLRSDGENLYGIADYDGKESTLCRYDLKTEEITPIVPEHNNWYNEMFTVYSDLVFVYNQNEDNAIVSDVYDLSGRKLCTIDMGELEEYSDRLTLQVSDGYVYISTNVVKTTGEGGAEQLVEFMYDVMYRCSVDDIKSGNVNFELVYKRNEYYLSEVE